MSIVTPSPKPAGIIFVNCSRCGKPTATISDYDKDVTCQKCSEKSR